MRIRNQTCLGVLVPKLREELKMAGLTGALLSVHTPRFWQVIMRPVLLMRNGWSFQAGHEVPVYRLGAPPQNGSQAFQQAGQTLVVSRQGQRKQLVLLSFCRGAHQEIRVDLATRQVLSDLYEI